MWKGRIERECVLYSIQRGQSLAATDTCTHTHTHTHMHTHTHLSGGLYGGGGGGDSEGCGYDSTGSQRVLYNDLYLCY